MDDPRYRVFHGKLSDKFGDYGIVLFGIAEAKGSSWHISSMLMSCRAFGRGIEHAFLSLIANKAKESGADKISIAFTSSEKNAPAKEFVDALFKDGVAAVTSIAESPDWIKIAV